LSNDARRVANKRNSQREKVLWELVDGPEGVHRRTVEKKGCSKKWSKVGWKRGRN